MNTTELHKLLGDTECDCIVCRNARHRRMVWDRHNAGRDYPGIRARIMERANEPRDPDWKRAAEIDARLAAKAKTVQMGRDPWAEARAMKASDSGETHD